MANFPGSSDKIPGLLSVDNIIKSEKRIEDLLQELAAKNIKNDLVKINKELSALDAQVSTKNIDKEILIKLSALMRKIKFLPSGDRAFIGGKINNLIQKIEKCYVINDEMDKNKDNNVTKEIKKKFNHRAVPNFSVFT